jgi:hypothetical protein
VTAGEGICQTDHHRPFAKVVGVPEALIEPHRSTVGLTVRRHECMYGCQLRR